jgi:hypothetical protein
MTNRSGAKGSDAEREVQALLRRLMKRPQIRRALGAGRQDDVGDIDGVPHTAIQVKWLASPLKAINEGINQIEQQRLNRRVRFGVVFVRRTRVRVHPWIVVMTPEMFARIHKYAVMGVDLERQQRADSVPPRVTRPRRRAT